MDYQMQLLQPVVFIWVKLAHHKSINIASIGYRKYFLRQSSGGQNDNFISIISMIHNFLQAQKPSQS